MAKAAIMALAAPKAAILWMAAVSVINPLSKHAIKPKRLYAVYSSVLNLYCRGMRLVAPRKMFRMRMFYRSGHP